MKRLFFALVFLTSSVAALAQYSITGKVTDSISHESIPFVLVHVENTYNAISTNVNGEFTLRNISNPTCVLVFKMLGYDEKKVSLDLKNQSVITVSLIPASTLKDEYVVYATRAGENSGIAYTTISKEDIAQQNYGQDLPILLNQQTSVVTTSDAGAGIGYTGIRIRGSDATRVNVTINGIPVNDAESQGVYWVDMPDIASSTGSIQIQRGVGTSTNGAGAFGASVSLMTEEASNTAYGEVSSSMGSFNTWRVSAKAGTGMIHDHWKFETRLSRISSAGYVDRSSSDLNSWYMSGAYYGSKLTVKAITFSGKERTYQSWYGVPQDSLKTNPTYNPAGEYFDANGNLQYYDNQTDNYQQDYYQLHFLIKGNAFWNFNTALHATKGKGYYEEYKAGESLSDYGLDTGSVVSDLIRRKWLSNWFYGITYGANYDNHKKTRLIIGGSLNNYEGQHYRQVIWAQTLPPYATNPFEYSRDFTTKTDFNIFARLNYQLNERFNVALDLQYRDVIYRFQGPDTSGEILPQQIAHNLFNPKAAITCRTSVESYAYLSFAVGNKEPNRDDYKFSTISSRPASESLYDLEAGWKFNNEKLALDANLYYMQYKNQLILTGKINDVGEYTRENVRESYRRGLELAASYRIGKEFIASANTTFSQNKVVDFIEYIDDYDNGGQLMNQYGLTDLAFSPAATGALVFNWNHSANSKGHHAINGMLTGKYVGKQYLDNTSTESRSINSYFTCNALMSWSPIENSKITDSKKQVRELQFGILVNNLLNTFYVSNGYTFGFVSGGTYNLYNYYFPQAGTNFLFRVTVKI
jgi:iron complex outermembrane recepter protein